MSQNVRRAVDGEHQPHVYSIREGMSVYSTCQLYCSYNDGN